jgi:predicted small lipoprotein YifL
MNLPFLLPGRAVVMAGMLVLALAACGRRGPPEAPLSAAEVAAQQQSAQARQQRQQAQAQVDDDDEEVRTDVMVPTPTAPRRRSRAYTIPKEPFILDPLL